MDKDTLMQRLMPTFLGELDEHVRSLNRDLLALEKAHGDGPSSELLQQLFRTVHSLKGAARSVDVHVIADACHRFEEIISLVQSGALVLDAGHFTVLFAAADGIDDAAARLRRHGDASSGPLSQLLPQLEAVVTGAAAPAGTTLARAAAPARGESAALPTRRRPPDGTRRDDSDSRAAQVAVHEKETSGGDGAGFVRVPAEKLDRLLAQCSELLVARRRVAARADELAGVRDSVVAWKAAWRAAMRTGRRELSPERIATWSFTFRSNGGSSAPSLSETGRNSRRAVQALGRVEDNLKRLESDLDQLSRALASDERLLDQAADRLGDEVDRARMLPFADACQSIERTVRDLARAGGKEVRVVIEGGNVELDRSILDALRDPLLHLVRNAVDHGIETVDERRGAGKATVGTITIGAALRGTQVEVVVSDDGRGVNLGAICAQAHKKGIALPAHDQDLIRLVFQPGLSASPIITDVSGRGVGLDVVKSRVESLLGTVDVESEPGRGARFTLSLPLTLTRLRVVWVVAGAQTFALAGTNVHKLVRLKASDLRSVEGRDIFSLDGRPVLVASLARTLGFHSRETVESDGQVPALVVAAGPHRVAFVVDQFIAEQEVVIKGLGRRVRRVSHVSGATLLPSGNIALILNAASVVRTALSQAASRAAAPAVARAEPAPRKRLLVVDDSVTTRSLVESILEAAGYDVTVAVDGEAAWKLLQERDTDLIVSDVEMPRMDGFTLTQTVRASKRFQELPIVLVTARESEQDKARGIEAGADAYLTKSTFDQRNLLETIGQLL